MHAISKFLTSALAAASLVAAAPAAVVKRDPSPYSDAEILQYALTLEHLERAFYRDSLNRFSAQDFASAGFPTWVRQRFTEVAAHEKAHVDFLTAGLSAAGATPVQECTYNFGVGNPRQFLALSQILEGVGVAAYLGAAPSIDSDDYLAAAGSVLVVETQHKTWTDSAADIKDPFPRAFAAGLDFNQVFSLAAPFITSCPANQPKLPFYTFPALTIENQRPKFYIGEKVSFKFDQKIVDTARKNGQKLYAAFVAAAGVEYVELNSNCGEVKIPAGIAGQSFLIITNGKFLCDAATVAGPAIIEVELPASDMKY